MRSIINENNLRGIMRKIIQEEIKKELPKSQVDALWKYLNKLDERIKVLEVKNG